MVILQPIEFCNFFIFYYDKSKDVVLNTKKKYYQGVNATFEMAFRNDAFLDRFDETRSSREETRKFISQVYSTWLDYHPTSLFWLITYNDRGNRVPRSVAVTNSITTMSWMERLFVAYSSLRKNKQRQRERRLTKVKVLHKNESDDFVFHFRNINAVFTFKPLTLDEKEALKKVSDGPMFGSTKKEERRGLYGVDCYNRHLSDCRMLLDIKNTTLGPRFLRWKHFSSTIVPMNIKRWKVEFLKLECMCNRLAENGIISLRALWIHALTSECTVLGWNGKVYRGCGRCDGCTRRFCQATNIIKSSSGVRDDIAVSHWGSVYKSTKYRTYGLEEYAGMSMEDYAAVAKTTLFRCTATCGQERKVFLKLLQR
jgi:hypothetical protein